MILISDRATAVGLPATARDNHEVRVTEQTDVLVVGAGPAGAAAATWAALAGRDVLLADAAVFPRDKSCGDGLTPRAVGELRRLGLAEWLTDQPQNWGLRAAGFGRELYLPWPGGKLPAVGSAVPRTELDARIRQRALAAGATALDGAQATHVDRTDTRVEAVHFMVGGRSHRVACRTLIVADGARSQLGRVLGRQWHQETVYGVAIRAYSLSSRAHDPWISSHLELRDDQGGLLSGYGWVFPLGHDQVNIGVGTLATKSRPANVQLRHVLQHYAQARRDDWQLTGPLLRPRSALLPMGGAVSSIAGRNWALIGDAAGCVNPLNGEGIDYGLETGRLVVDLLAHESDWTQAWPRTLQLHYGPAFSIARRLAGLITVPGLLPTCGPIGLSSRSLMKIALRLMGNLMTAEDADLVARLWRTAGRISSVCDPRRPFASDA